MGKMPLQKERKRDEPTGRDGGWGKAIEVKCDTQGNNKHSKIEKRTTGVWESERVPWARGEGARKTFFFTRFN